MPAFHFPPVTADRQIKDGDSVSLGNVRMTARLGAGHTRGATTWITKVEDGGRTYDVVFPCCTSINPGYRLIVHPSYPGIADDYARTLAMLESLHPDVWLPAHAELIDFEGRRGRAPKDGVEAFVDPEGYGAWLAKQKGNFEQLLAKEKLLGESERATGLAGTSWRLVRFQGGDGTTLTPDDGSKYTIEFKPEGRLAARTRLRPGHRHVEVGHGESARARPTGPVPKRLPVGGAPPRAARPGLDLRPLVRPEGRPPLRLADGRRRDLRVRAGRERARPPYSSRNALTGSRVAARCAGSRLAAAATAARAAEARTIVTGSLGPRP